MKDNSYQVKPLKFSDPYYTADGSPRAQVDLSHPDTLWFNTGTLCNIECLRCYIESSPTNDALAYMTSDEVTDYLDQLDARQWNVREIGFTGGEPFMNPQILDMMTAALARGYDVLVLTNAMRPMTRSRVQSGLAALQATYGAKLTLRVSMDHFTTARHDEERGTGSFDIALKGMRWLRDVGIQTTVAGRSLWNESEADARLGYARLFEDEGFQIAAQSPADLIIFPEMDQSVEVPEITTACWGILGKTPQSVMCASSRMVVKRRRADRPSVVACTLLPYDPKFEMGTSLAEAEASVSLNHPHCAKFCVLGGASCSS
jgi:hypothetical protein